MEGAAEAFGLISPPPTNNSNPNPKISRTYFKMRDSQRGLFQTNSRESPRYFYRPPFFRTDVGPLHNSPRRPWGRALVEERREKRG